MRLISQSYVFFVVVIVIIVCVAVDDDGDVGGNFSSPKCLYSLKPIEI